MMLNGNLPWFWTAREKKASSKSPASEEPFTQMLNSENSKRDVGGNLQPFLPSRDGMYSGHSIVSCISLCLDRYSTHIDTHILNKIGNHHDHGIKITFFFFFSRNFFFIKAVGLLVSGLLQMP